MTRSLAGAIDLASSLEAIRLHLSRDADDVLDTFGSRNAILREVSIDPAEVTETASIHEHTATIHSLALVNRWTASVSTVRTSGMKREIADVYVEDLPLHEESGSVS